MDEIAELLSAAAATANAARSSSTSFPAHTTTTPAAGGGVYVVATTIDETRQAIATARVLAHERHGKLTVLATWAEPVTISVSRANVYDLPADLVRWPDCTVAVARPLLSAVDEPADLVVVPELTVQELTKVVPPHASVVICGPLRWVLGSPEQRLASKLARRAVDVIFLPYVADRSAAIPA